MQNKSKSPSRVTFSESIHSKAAMSSVIFLSIITIVSIVVPLIAPFPASQQDLLNTEGGMTTQNILNTDSDGRSSFGRSLYAGRTSLSVGVISTIGMLLIGVTVGVVLGYFGGIVDTLLMRVAEFVMLFPFLIFAIVSNTALGDKIKSPYGSAIILVLVIIVLSWGGIARLVRSEMLQEKENEYFLTAKSIGIPTYKTILRHLLLNILSVAIIQATLLFAGMIVVESGLSSLGFGISKTIPSWGNVLSDAQEGDVISGKSWMRIPSAIMIILTTLSISFVEEGIKDAPSPRGRR